MRPLSTLIAAPGVGAAATRVACCTLKRPCANCRFATRAVHRNWPRLTADANKPGNADRERPIHRLVMTVVRFPPLWRVNRLAELGVAHETAAR